MSPLLRQRPRQDDASLADTLAASLPKRLAHELADALGITVEEEPASSQLRTAPVNKLARQLSRPIRDRADWIRRIEDKNDPNHALIIAADGVQFAPAFLN